VRVAVELTALELDRGGTARAIEQLLPLLREDPRLELTELSHGGRSPDGRFGVLVRGLARELAYMPRGLRSEVRQSGAELLHCMSPLAPLKVDVPLVVTLYDAIGWDHPEWLSNANVLQLKRVLPRAVANNDTTIVTSSEYSKLRIADALGLDPERVAVVPLGLDPRFAPERSEQDTHLLERLGIDDRFVLTVGTLQPRKNVEAAIAAFERLEGRDGLKLVIAGARGWHDDELLERIKRSEAAADIFALGKVTDDQLIALYRGAECLVFPSRYEGFGFPPLEAMACGTPVLSTTNTSLAEAVGAAAVEIDPDDPDQISDAIARVLASDELRAELTTRGAAQASRFTWERCRDGIVDVYSAALARA
jgi:alpha-1,3-rhamnosyl/mannosyltransferase